MFEWFTEFMESPLGKLISTGILAVAVLLLTLAVSASAAAVKMTVGVRFWRESGDKESMADSAVDTTRELPLPASPTASSPSSSRSSSSLP